MAGFIRTVCIRLVRLVRRYKKPNAYQHQVTFPWSKFSVHCKIIHIMWCVECAKFSTETLIVWLYEWLDSRAQWDFMSQHMFGFISRPLIHIQDSSASAGLSEESSCDGAALVNSCSVVVCWMNISCLGSLPGFCCDLLKTSRQATCFDELIYRMSTKTNWPRLDQINSRKACHRLKTYLQLASPVCMEKQSQASAYIWKNPMNGCLFVWVLWLTGHLSRVPQP